MFNTLIEVQELHEHLGDPDWVIVDCRYDLLDSGAGYRSYLEAHIPGALYAHLHDDLSGPPVTDHGRHPLPEPLRLERVFSELGIDADVQVVVYDDSAGSIAARLWWMLQYMEHSAAAVLDGGWQAWRAAGYETPAEETRARTRRFRGRPRRDWLVTLDQVAGVPCLVDSRDPARFRGDLEPIDPVAGHIPGARNYHWRRNVDEDGKFRSAHSIREQLQELYDNIAPDQVAFYCGSGVSACHNILAAARAGLPSPRLYAGSWSEWCSDPSRPVAVGEG